MLGSCLYNSSVGKFLVFMLVSWEVFSMDCYKSDRSFYWVLMSENMR